MKTYTDIEQSKKLKEILPLDSADVWFADGSFPCWSLGALLAVLPEPTLTNTNSIWRCILSYKWGNSYFEKGKIQKTVSSKEPIDACYEMILQLGPNLLSKLKL